MQAVATKINVTAYFEHIADLDPLEWEAGQRKAIVVSFPHGTGKLSKAEVSKLKAAHTGYRLLGLYADTEPAALVVSEF